MAGGGCVGTHSVFRELHRRARHHDLEIVLEGDLLDIAVGNGLLVSAHVADGAHALAGDVVFREEGFPLGDGFGLEDGVEPRDDLDDEVCLVQRLQAGGAGIVGDLRHAEQICKLRQLAAVLIVEHADPLAVAALVEMTERVGRAQGGVRALAAKLRLVGHDAPGGMMWSGCYTKGKTMAHAVVFAEHTVKGMRDPWYIDKHSGAEYVKTWNDALRILDDGTPKKVVLYPTAECQVLDNSKQFYKQGK